MEDAAPAVLKAVSGPKKGHGRIEWTIDQFRLYRSRKTDIYSPKLPLKNCGFPTSNASWFLGVSPTDLKSTPSATGVYLEISECAITKVHARFSLSVFIPATGTWDDLRRPTDAAVFNVFDSKITSWGVANALPHKTLFAKASKYLSEAGSLSLKAEIEFFIDDTENFTVDHIIQGPTKEPSINNDASKPDQKGVRDLTIVSSDKRKFLVYQATLQAHPSVFAAMMKNGKTNSAGELSLPETDGNTLDFLLDFLSSGNIHHYEQMAEPLLQAAVKYVVEDLQKLVIDYLSRHVTSESAGHLLVVANQQGLDTLEEAVLTFIAHNPLDVMTTDGWQKVLESPKGKDLLVKVRRSMGTSTKKT